MKQLIFLLLFILPGWCWSQQNSTLSGQPVPVKKTEHGQCPDSSLTAIRLLGQTPHVPFAVVNQNTITSAGQSCCKEWATAQSEWFNLNEHGKVVGTSTTITAQLYDVTQCHELQLETITGQDGVGLYTSKDIDWELSNEQTWSPTSNEKATLNDFILQLNQLAITNRQIDFPDTLIKEKMMFFKIAQPYEEVHGLGQTRCVVFGKRYLMIAYLNGQEDWILAHIENEYTNSEFKQFTPIALIDINQDGVPEIIYRDSLGHAFWDKMLRLQNVETIDSWEIEAISVGGATL